MYSGRGQGTGTGEHAPGAGDTGGGTGNTMGVPIWDTESSNKIETTRSNNSRSHVQNNNNTTSRMAHQLSQADLPFVAAMNKSLSLTHTSRPYLRHSWNRVDAVAILAFWTTFALCTLGVEKTPDSHLYLFRALSVLRTTRLLAITSGTTTIMLSLKRAAPQLVNVAMFVLFAVVLFSIVGVQSFGGSFRRNCVLGTCWIPFGFCGSANFVLTTSISEAADGIKTITLSQQCGRWIDPATLLEVGYKTAEGVVTDSFKGFTCPFGQVCQVCARATLYEPSLANRLSCCLSRSLSSLGNHWKPRIKRHAVRQHPGCRSTNHHHCLGKRMVDKHVRDDVLGILHFFRLLHHLPHRVEFLAFESIRRGYHPELRSE